MPIIDAMKFIKSVAADEELRNILYTLPTEKIYQELETLGFKFDVNDFEESINMLHVKCQTEEEVEQLFQVVNWFKMLCN
jgi:hypothetical protein